MRILRLLTAGDDVRAFAASLFRSDEFRSGVRSPGSYIARWVERLAERPLAIIEVTDPDIETSQFFSWMGSLCLRTYENPVVSDLYYLHEMVHIATMEHRPGLAFESWREKMIDNELRASLESEALVYFEMPGLRTKSFPFAIWVDRFLSDEVSVDGASRGNHELYRQDPHRFIQALRSLRLSLRFKDPAARDEIETQIAHYARQNEVWSEIWRDGREEIEGALSRIMALPVDAAAAELGAWLRRVADRGGGVPFREEAEVFAAIYHAKKKADQAIYARNPRQVIDARETDNQAARTAAGGVT